MIPRFWLIFGILFVGVAWYLMVPASPPPHQAAARGFIEDYRQAGLLPPPGGATESEEIEHDVFEVPPEDAERVPPGEEEGAGLEILAQGTAKEVDAALAGTMAAGMAKEVVLDMTEWRFGQGRLQLATGDVVRLLVRNTGNTPHEFMIMSKGAMEGVSYRLARADWNLTEHEAVVEKSFLLPGEETQIVFRVKEPGMWMYMCMFPYHMQLGMMGMIMAAGEGGMSMPMGDGKSEM